MGLSPRAALCDAGNDTIVTTRHANGMGHKSSHRWASEPPPSCDEFPMQRLIPCLLICLALVSCTKRAGHGYMSTLFLSESTSDFEHVSVRLHQWLLSHGLSETTSPGGLAAWSGTHVEGERPQWYSLPVGRHSVLLRITLDPRSKEINADTDYDGYFTDSELTAVCMANLKLWNDLFDWVEAQPERNEVLTHDPLRFDHCRSEVARAYLNP